MIPAKIFSIRINLLVIFVAIFCGIYIRNGLINNDRKEIAQDEASKWLDGPQSESELSSYFFSAHSDQQKAVDEFSDDEQTIALAKIDHLNKVSTYLKKVKYGEDTIQEYSEIQDSKSSVYEIIQERIDKMPYMTKNTRYTLWAVIIFSGFFVFLSSLRFALK
jgi:hypothetical protein